MALYNYDKIFEVRGPGTQISQYVQKARLGTIDSDTIRSIVCKYTSSPGVCGFREIIHGRNRNPLKVVINETQYNELVALVNPA